MKIKQNILFLFLIDLTKNILFKMIGNYGKDPDTGKDCRQEKGMPEDEMVGWHHQLDKHESE